MSAGGKWVVGVVCAVAVFRIALEVTIVSVAVPEIESEFSGSSRATVAWVFTSYNIVVASLLLIGGWLAERHGRKRIFLTGLWIFALGSLASGLAPSLVILIAGRVVQGIGAALVIPASLALILQAMGPIRREMAVAIWGAMAGLAAAMGPIVGAVLVGLAGWRWVFLTDVPVAIAAALFVSGRFVESSGRLTTSHVDLVAVPTGAVGVGSFVYAVVIAGSNGWTDSRVLVASIAAVLLLAVFARRSMTHRSPVFDPAIARSRSFSVASIALLFFAAGFSAWLVFAPIFLVRQWGYSTLLSGLAVAPAPIMIAVVAGSVGRWASTCGHRIVIVTGCLVASCGAVWWTVWVGAEPDYLFALLPGVVLLGIGAGLAMPRLTAAAMRDVDSTRYAMAAAGNTTLHQLATAIGIAVGVALVSSGNGSIIEATPLSWMVSAAFFVIAAMTIGFGYPDSRRAVRTEAAVSTEARALVSAGGVVPRS